MLKAGLKDSPSTMSERQALELAYVALAQSRANVRYAAVTRVRGGAKKYVIYLSR